MNNLLKIEPLTNRYFIMRHGRSLANQLELIVSSPENGVESYGLDDKGREQVIDSVEATKAILDVSLISSIFVIKRYPPRHSCGDSPLFAGHIP